MVANEQKVAVTSSKADHVSQAIFFPLPLKNETVSHPVKEWNMGKATERSGPRAFAT